MPLSDCHNCLSFQDMSVLVTPAVSLLTILVCCVKSSCTHINYSYSSLLSSLYMWSCVCVPCSNPAVSVQRFVCLCMCLCIRPPMLVPHQDKQLRGAGQSPQLPAHTHPVPPDVPVRHQPGAAERVSETIPLHCPAVLPGGLQRVQVEKNTFR